MAFLDRLFRKPSASAASESDRENCAAPEAGATSAEPDTSGVSAAAECEEYRAVGLTLIPLGFDNVLVHAPDGRSAQLIPAATAEYVGRCNTFATLDEHAARIDQELGLGSYHRDDIREQLRQCAEHGFLMPRRSVVRDWPPAHPVAGAKISTAGVTTANRVAATQRALESYLANSARHGRTVDWVVYDDSTDEPVRAEYRQMLASLKAGRDARLLYAGAPEKRRYARWLVEAGLPVDVIEFCLFGAEGCGRTTGANHNAMLLDTVGEASLAVDDDTICQLGPPPAVSAGVELCGAGDPTEFWFYRDAEAARNAVVPEDKDVLALHEDVLGRALRDCVSGSATPPPPLLLERANDRLIQAFAAGDSRIAATSMGLAGDSGMGSTLYYLSLRGDSRERLVEHPDAYPAFVANRAVIRAAPRLTLCSGMLFMAFAVGLDNRELLPPFFPVMRNSDGVFGAVMTGVAPNSFFGHLPWVLAHAPPEIRSETRATLDGAAARPQVAELVIRMVEFFTSTRVGHGSVPDRTRALGQDLKSLARLGTADFEEFVRSLVWRSRARVVAHLEQGLRLYEEQPEPWALDVRRCLDAIRTSLPRREAVIPSDVSAGHSPDEALAMTQRLISRYGELLSAWPDIVEAARGLRAQERRLAEPV